jgi:transcriptional regulator GlxA family with amidase domain
MTYGETPHQWRSRIRVERAKTLLQETSLTIVDIAKLCGFRDQSHLTRLFGQHMGMPSARWRRHDRA